MPEFAGQARLGPTFAQLYGLMPPARRRQLFGLLFLMLLSALAELISIGSLVPFLSLLAGGSSTAGPTWVEPALAPIARATGLSIYSAAAMIFMTAAIVAAAVRLALSWASQSFTLGVGHELSVEIQRRVLHQPYIFHVTQHSSRVLASLEKIQILSSGILLHLMQAASAVIIGTFIIFAVASVDLGAAAIAGVAFGACYLLVSRFASPRLAHDATILGEAYDRRLRLIQESLGGIRDVIVDQSQTAHVEEFRAIDARFTQARLRSGFLITAPRFVLEAAGMVLIAALAAFLSSTDGGLAIALPVLGALSLGALRLLPLLQQLYQAWVGLSANRAILGDVGSLLSLPVPAELSAAGALPFLQSIQFRDVSFCYPNRDAPALRNIDLEIPRGVRAAIVGKTGSGKSTLVDLLMGLLEPSEGTIEVDGVTLDGRSRKAWQRSVAHVPQSVFIADTSIARNIALGGTPTSMDRERIAEAVRLARLDDVIAGLPAGLDARVGEGGVMLSGGQRQRLGLARAIYKDAPVLILDEATNALDHETEQLVLNSLDRLQEDGRTIIMISHRESAVQGCDIVIRLDHGKLVR
jgi:ATP-binding cassette, subfamily B, bacterial PglK